MTIAYQVKRWIDPAKGGWWSGDHHIHAAGCQHYENPTEGVHPPDMMRHCLGEDLKVGACLTWGHSRAGRGWQREREGWPHHLTHGFTVDEEIHTLHGARAEARREHASRPNCVCCSKGWSRATSSALLDISLNRTQKIIDELRPKCSLSSSELDTSRATNRPEARP